MINPSYVAKGLMNLIRGISKTDVPIEKITKPGVFKNVTGVGKDRTSYANFNDYLTARSQLPTTAQRLNPLVSTNRGRITLPRILAVPGAISTGVIAKDMYDNRNNPSTTATDAEIAAINAQSQADALAGYFAQARQQMAPDYKSLAEYQDAANQIASGLSRPGNALSDTTNYGTAGGGQNAAALAAYAATGSGLTPVSGAASSNPSYLRESGNIDANTIDAMARAKDYSGAGQMSTAYGKDKLQLMYKAAELAAMQNADANYQDFLSQYYKGTTAPTGTQYTADSPGIQKAYLNWNNISGNPKSKITFAQMGVNTFDDYYKYLKQTQPDVYGQ